MVKTKGELKVSNEREKKKALRKEMLGLMNQDNDWFKDETTERYKRIRELAILLGVDTGVDRMKRLTRKEFEQYVAQGFSMQTIAVKVGVTEKRLRDWRVTHGYPADVRGQNKKNTEMRKNSCKQQK